MGKKKEARSSKPTSWKGGLAFWALMEKCRVGVSVGSGEGPKKGEMRAILGGKSGSTVGGRIGYVPAGRGLERVKRIKGKNQNVYIKGKVRTKGKG